MGTSAGPNLAGIGRGGDSNLVLEMDAHDAKSYPGEPTANYIKHTADGIPVSWWGDGSNQSIGAKGAVDITDPSLKYNGYPTILWTPGDSYNGYLNGTADIDQTALSTVWTFSCYVKAEDEGTLKTSGNDLFMYFYRGTGSYPSDSGTGTVMDAGDGWYRLSLSVSGTSDYAGLVGFSNFRAGVKFYLSGAQLEKKSYPTPVVTGLLNSGEVYDARPATTNLMIHVNVGTGTSFYDSSPSKHTITSVGGATHSNTQSKFSGGSFYLDGGDYLTIAPSSDFDFGTGSFTIDAWIRRDNLTNDDTIWGNGVAEASATAMWYFNTSGELRFLAANNTFLTTSSAGIAINTWYHIALVKNGTTLTAYVNGVSKGSATVSGSFGSASQTMHVGARDSHSAYIFTGYMDEFRVTKGTPLWLSDFTPPTRRNLSAPVVDRSGNDNGINLINGTDSGGTAYRTGEVIEPLATAVLDFDGTDDYAIVGDSDDWNFGSESFAIEQWLYFTDFSPSGDGWNCALQQYAAEADRNGWMLFYNNGSDFQWRLECTATTPNFMPTHIVTGCSLNTWHLFTISRQGSVFKMYIDGVLRGTDTSNPTFDNIGGPMYVGNYAAGDPHEFQGKMGALRIYKGTSLSDEQVKENFRTQSSRFNVLNWANNAILQNGLDLWLDAGENSSYPGAGSTWYDLTNNNYNGTIANAVYNRGYGNGSFTFDGSGDTVDVGPISTGGEHSYCTISVWMNKIAQVATYGNVYDCNYGLTALNKGPRMEVDAGGSIVRVYMGSDAGNYTSVSFGSLSNSVWYNLVLTISPSSTNQVLKSYTDGALVSTYTSSSTYVWDGDVGDLYLGVGFNSGRHFTGKIAAFELYNRVLSASEIEQNFIVQKQRFDK